MKRAMTILFWAHLLAIACSTLAQEETEVPWSPRGEVRKETGNDNPRATTSLGMPLNAPLSPIAQHVSWGLGLTAGAGYNFTRRHALVGDFMWNSLYPTNQTLRPIQIALHTNKVSGHGNLFALTGGYKLELRGRTLGTYFIGGGGWYYRTASLSRPVPDGTTLGCIPARVYWGYYRSSGVIVCELTTGQSNPGPLGWHGGG